MPYSKRRKTTYRRKRIKGYTKAKKMVTGRGPTLLDKIASGVGSVARLATAVAPAIAAINTEHKYYDQTAVVSASQPGTNDNLINLTQNIVQGVNDTNRIGNSILAKDIQIRLAINFNSTVGTPNVLGAHCRMMLICWKENIQQNAPDVNKIFEDASNLYSPVNKNNSDSFVVIKDKFFSLNNSSGLAGSSGFTHMKLYKPLNWHIRWEGSTGNQGTQNHVYLIMRCANGSGSALSTTYYSRLNFTDN